jgi:hypothetical protein
LDKRKKALSDKKKRESNEREEMRTHVRNGTTPPEKPKKVDKKDKNFI